MRGFNPAIVAHLNLDLDTLDLSSFDINDYR